MNKTLDLWRRWFIGELLHLANSYPPTLAKYEFYRLKDFLLREYGTPDGHDIQHIVKPCYSCEDGKVTEVLKNCGLVVSTTRACWRCNGTGVYEQFWTDLLRYTVGRRGFHLPERKYYKEPCLVIARPVIKGYVKHKHYPYYLSTEAFLLLALIFNFELFRKNFGRCGMSSWKFTPLVLFSDLTWRIKRLFRFNAIRQLRYRINVALWEFKQRHCRHEFPPTSWDFDECRKCGIARWETTIPSDFLSDELPF